MGIADRLVEEMLRRVAQRGIQFAIDEAERALNARRRADSTTNNRAREPYNRSRVRTDHEILGVTPNATKDEIKRAYREKARKLHPDLNKTDTTIQMQELNSAYERLRR